MNVMKVVVLNIYVTFLTFYVNRKTFCSCDSFKSYIGYTDFTGDIQHDEIQYILFLRCGLID